MKHSAHYTKYWTDKYITSLLDAIGAAALLGLDDDKKRLFDMSRAAMGLTSPRKHDTMQSGSAKTGGKRTEEVHTMTIYGRAITDSDMRNIADYMDDAIREELHSKLAPCSNDDFLREYINRDPDILDILRTEFDFKL